MKHGLFCCLNNGSPSKLNLYRVGVVGTPFCFRYTGVAISTVFLILTAVVMLTRMAHDAKQVAGKILLNICFTIVASQLTFSFGVDRAHHTSKASCVGTAIALHYLLLSSWGWMVSEAWHLRERFVVVVRPSDEVRKFALASYLIPAIVVIVSASL